MPVETITHLDRERRFGFIRGYDISYYFKLRDVVARCLPKLKVGSAVAFNNGAPIKGPTAIAVRLTSGHELNDGLKTEQAMVRRSKRKCKRPKGFSGAGVGGRVAAH